MAAVTVEVPDSAFSALRRSPKEFAREMRIAAAIQWYQQTLISQGKAAEIAGLCRADFLDALFRAKVPASQVTIEEMKEELGVWSESGGAEVGGSELGGAGFQPVDTDQPPQESELQAKLAGPEMGGAGFQPVISEKPTRRNLPHIQKPGCVHHLVFRTRGTIMPAPARRIALDACLFWNGEKCLIHACAVMPDHVHLLLEPTPAPDGSGFHSLAEILHSIKSYSAKQINKLLNQRGSFWLDETYDRYIRSESDFDEKLDSIASNPVVDGLVERSEDYPFLYLRGAGPES